jgi:hypothetical protein
VYPTRDTENTSRRERAAPHLAPVLELLELAAQHLHAPRDVAPVEFQLRLARAAGLAEPAALALEVRPAAHQARRHVLELSQLHLELALVGLRALREDFQDHLGAVEHARLQFFLQVALLRRRKRMVDQHEAGVEALHRAADLLDLATAAVELGVGAGAPAAHQRMALRPRALGEAHEFFDRFLVAVVAEIQAHEHRRGRVRAARALREPRDASCRSLAQR